MMTSLWRILSKAVVCIVLSVSVVLAEDGRDQYSLPNDWEHADPRLKALEDSLDPHSKKELQGHLVQKSQRSILEVGPGRGTMAIFMSEHAETVDVLDYDDTYFNLIKARSKNISTLHGDLRDIELADKKYDLIYWRFVMLHIPDTDHLAITNKLYQSLKPGGILVAEELVQSSRKNSLAIFDQFGEGLSQHMILMSSMTGGKMDFNSGFDFEDKLKESGFTLSKSPYLFVEECYGGQPCAMVMKYTFQQLHEQHVFDDLENHEALYPKLYNVWDDPKLRWFPYQRLFITATKPGQIQDEL